MLHQLRAMRGVMYSAVREHLPIGDIAVRHAGVVVGKIARDVTAQTGREPRSANWRTSPVRRSIHAPRQAEPRRAGVPEPAVDRGGRCGLADDPCHREAHRVTERTAGTTGGGRPH
ncbi:hypothetical protein GCM10017691_18860 [Pseudonocardia petroleophila]